jgi:hypothetical protein
MASRILAACCWIWLIPAVAAAQTAPRTLEQLTKDVLELQQKLTATSENLTKLAEQVGKNTAATTLNAQGIERLTTIINTELGKQQDILERIDELTRQQQTQLARQQEILDAVTQPDAQGNNVLRLGTNMDNSEEFREDVRQAVHRSLETHGQVTIRNRMESAQTVIVNQREHRLGAGEILTLRLPVGTVTAQLPGQPLTNWTLTAPTYTQKIDIVPEAPLAITVYRPLDEVAVPPATSLPTEPAEFVPLPYFGTSVTRTALPPR